MTKFYNVQLSIRQVMLLYVAPQRYEATESGLTGFYYEEVAETLNRLYKLFSVSGVLFISTFLATSLDLNKPVIVTA